VCGPGPVEGRGAVYCMVSIAWYCTVCYCTQSHCYGASSMSLAGWVPNALSGTQYRISERGEHRRREKRQARRKHKQELKGQATQATKHKTAADVAEARTEAAAHERDNRHLRW